MRAIIVDNSADHNLAAVAQEMDAGLPILWTHEPRKGVSRGRNKCLDFLQPDEIACFIDDDVILPDSFLEDLLAVLRGHPDLDVFGGRVELANALDLPITIKRSTTPQSFCLTQSPFGFFHGCCMVARPAALRAIGRFDEKLGAGTPTRSGEDSDFILRAALKGLKVGYRPEFFLYHDHGRRDPSDREKLMTGYWYGQGALYAKSLFKWQTPVLRLLYWQMHGDLRGLKFWDRRVARDGVTLKRYGAYIAGAAAYIWSNITLKS
ncbi:MAG: hypothetical protein Tsb0016_12650 [Sphingomonadales bacterium]